MANEAAIDVLEPAGQASLQNVTALPRRETDAEHPDPGSSPNVTALPRTQADMGASQPPPARDDISAIDQGILSQKLSEAELMLAHAAETGKKLSPEVIAALTNARDAHARHAWTKALTEQFWPAYSRLCAAIRPVTGESLTACAGNGLANILKRYRTWTLYLVSLILPLSVLMFINTSISNEINDRIKENNALVVTLHDQLLNIQPGRAQNDVVTQMQQLATLNRSLYSLASLLNYSILGLERDPLSGVDKRQALQLPVPLTDLASAGFDKIKAYQDIRTFAKDVQQMNLMFYGAITAYCLPILYALLGACAYALRCHSSAGGLAR